MEKASIRKNGAGHAKKKTTIILGIIIIIIIQCNKQGGGSCLPCLLGDYERETMTILIVVVIAILNENKLKNFYIIIKNQFTFLSESILK